MDHEVLVLGPNDDPPPAELVSKTLLVEGLGEAAWLLHDGVMVVSFELAQRVERLNN